MKYDQGHHSLCEIAEKYANWALNGYLSRGSIEEFWFQISLDEVIFIAPLPSLDEIDHASLCDDAWQCARSPVISSTDLRRKTALNRCKTNCLVSANGVDTFILVLSTVKAYVNELLRQNTVTNGTLQ